MIREGDIGEKLFPDFPDMKVDFAEIGIGKIGKIGLAPPQIDLNLPQKMHQFISSTTVHLPTHLLYQHGCSSTGDTGVTQYWDIIAYFSRFFDTTRGSIFEGLKWSFFGQFSRFFFHLIHN